MLGQLKQKVISGVRWTASTMVIVTVLQFITLAILARLLSPSDFGLMGMVMLVVGLSQSLGDMGMSAAIVQRKTIAEEHLCSLFWVNCLMGILLFIAIFLARPLVVSYFREPLLSYYLTFAAFILLISSFGQIFLSLLARDLRFGLISQIEIGAAFVYSISAISLAFADFGALSLILGQLFRSLCIVIFLLVSFRKVWLPKLHFSLSEIRSYLGFGAFQMAERTSNYLYANIDSMIIGRFLGPEILGFYNLAQQIVIFPLTKINPIITNVAFPAFSRIQDDNKKIREAFCRIINYISLLSFPMLTGMFIVAPEFILLVYGKNWAPSIPLLQLFCFVGIGFSLGNPIGSVVLAKGRADVSFYWNLFGLALASGAVLAGVHWGAAGAAVGRLAVLVPLFFVIQPRVNKMIGLKFREYSAALRAPFFCSSVMLLITVLMRSILSDLHTLPLFVSSILCGMIVYPVCYFFEDRKTFFELRDFLTKT